MAGKGDETPRTPLKFGVYAYITRAHGLAEADWAKLVASKITVF